MSMIDNVEVFMLICCWHNAKISCRYVKMSLMCIPIPDIKPRDNDNNNDFFFEKEKGMPVCRS